MGKGILPMRIWFATAQKKETFGGVHRSVESLGEGLARRGHTVETFWASHEGGRSHYSFMLRLGARLLLSAFRQPRWIIARSSDGLVCAVLSRLGLTKTRVAIYSHGWEEKVYETEKRLPRAVISSPTTWKARFFRFPLLRAALALADLCLCGTIEEARYVAARYPRHRAKIKVVPNGVERLPVPFWPSRHGVPSSFLIVGGFTWKKNIEYGLELFKRVLVELPQAREARLFCVGTGPLPPHAQRIVNELGDSIFIVERERPELMSRWYETCPFLISTSRYEGGRSLALLEAQNRGMVVFASDIPSTREMIHDGKNGILLCGCDLSRDSALVVKTCTDFERCRSIGAAAWRSAGRQRWERQAERLEKQLRNADCGLRNKKH
jgi:glycosyltransferase involved in cell wall biosynthesis